MNSFYKRIKKKLNIKDVADPINESFIGNYFLEDGGFKTNDMAYFYDVHNELPNVFKRTIAGASNGYIQGSNVGITDSITKIKLPSYKNFKLGERLYIRVWVKVDRLGVISNQTQVHDRAIFYDEEDGINRIRHGYYIQYGPLSYNVVPLDLQYKMTTDESNLQHYGFMQTYQLKVGEPIQQAVYYVAKFVNNGLFGGWIFENSMNMVKAGQYTHLQGKEYTVLMKPQSANFPADYDKALYLPNGSHDLSIDTLFNVAIKPQLNGSVPI